MTRVMNIDEEKGCTYLRTESYGALLLLPTPQIIKLDVYVCMDANKKE